MQNGRKNEAALTATGRMEGGRQGGRQGYMEDIIYMGDIRGDRETWET